jgi:hypothetical protein
MDRPGHFPGKRWSARAAILIVLIFNQDGPFDLSGHISGATPRARGIAPETPWRCPWRTLFCTIDATRYAPLRILLRARHTRIPSTLMFQISVESMENA